MKRRLLLLSLAFGMLCPQARSEEVSQEAAQKTAQQFLRKLRGDRTAVKRLEHRPERMQTRDREPAAFYIFGAEDNRGFVIVSGEDRMPAVVGYSDRNTFRTDRELPAGLKAFLENYDRYVKAVRNGTATAPESITAHADLPASYGPIVETTWDQGDPYNRLCPGLCPSGCVATALAQIMYTHRWPEHGTGTAAVRYEGKTFSANLGESLYIWDDMKLKTADNRASEKAAAAVAVLNRDCGFATGMQYSPEGSGTTYLGVLAALTRHFGYKASSLRLMHRDCEPSTDRWMRYIKTELAADRPIYYDALSPGADGPDAGHAFVLDGYDSGDMVHVNWGWDGSANGFYDIVRLNPSGTGYEYTMQQGMIVGIDPARDGEQGEYVIHPLLDGKTTVDVSTSNYNKAGSGSFTVSSPLVWNPSHLTVKWGLGIGLYDEQGNYLTKLQSRSFTFTIDSGGGINPQEYNCKIPGGYADGNYSIRTYVKEGTAYLDPDVYGGQDNNRIYITIGGGKVTFNTTPPTGITNIPLKAEKGLDCWFDLNGRRITEPTRPGLYIHNGRKVVK